MSSSPPTQPVDENPPLEDGQRSPSDSQDAAAMSNSQRRPYAANKTPEPHGDQQAANSDPPDTPGVLDPFDWDEFEARYESALRDADEHEREILKEAEALSKYFKVWAAAASAHDDERAAKRLQTRRRFVNLSEDRMERKQEHYDQVVRAFENALALLKSQRRVHENKDMTQQRDVSAEAEYGVPSVSKDDLFAFHEAHFSQAAIASFGTTFINPLDQQHIQDGMDYDPWEEEDDGLGYYPDGVKRTLTDEQIEIFRHSELEALRKKQAKESDTKTVGSSDEPMDLSDDSPAPTQTEATSSAPPTSFQSNKKKKKKKGPKRGRPEPKPDLRKRTWDVVDKGLDSLDYD
ncbi:hypothetical protein LRP88_09053 [Fusarium phalaenopsidis]